MQSVFSQYVKKVFDSWTLLRIADQQASAGRDTKPKIQALVPHIVNRMTRQTDPSEVSEWLDDYLSQVLNVFCEDDSTVNVADLIVKAYALHLAGKHQEIAQMIAQVPPACDLAQCPSQVIVDEVDASDVSDDGDEEVDIDSLDDFSDEEMDVN